MKVLGTSCLALQAIVLGLAALVAGNLLGPPAGWVMLVLMILAVVGAYTLRSFGDVTLGWITQAGSLAASLLLPVTIPLAVIFAGLWWAALHFGRKADEISRTRTAS